MRVRIHRGTAEIGGNCVEIEADSGDRIVVDLGRPLWADSDTDVTLPPVAGLTETDPSLLGVVISHPHLDHYGLIGSVASTVPVFIGREASALLGAAAFFLPMTTHVEPAGFLSDGLPLTIGEFTITPHLNDHSAFDAYSLLIEGDGRRLFYTGDLRGHGRKSALFERLLATPPTAEVLLMEGTHVRPNADHDAAEFETESDLEERLVERMRDTPGPVALAGSAQNLDRLVTAYRAAKRAGRQLVVDLYGATVAAATRPTIPQVGFDNLRVYVPQRQRVLVKESGEFDRVRNLGDARVYPEELKAHPEQFAYHVPSSVIAELIRHGTMTAPGSVLWSLWPGYLRDRSGQRFVRQVNEAGLEFGDLHTSGHASVKDLQRLAAAIAAPRVVPMHSEATDRFTELFPGVERHSDGEWWSV